MRDNKMSAITKLTRFTIIADHPKMMDNSMMGCGIYFGAVEYRITMQIKKQILQIKAILNNNLNRLVSAFISVASSCSCG
jgi:hypothetical protein